MSAGEQLLAAISRYLAEHDLKLSTEPAAEIELPVAHGSVRINIAMLSNPTLEPKR